MLAYRYTVTVVKTDSFAPTPMFAVSNRQFCQIRHTNFLRVSPDTYIYMHLCMYTRICIYIRMYIRVCAYAYICIRLYVNVSRAS